RWAAGRQLARRLVITNDAEPLLAAASPAGWGIALIAGTGSFAVGRAPDGQSARCGGWGYLVGDEGSGYALALAGMRCVTRAADGRGPATQLLDRLLADWGISSPAELVPVLYGAEMTRRRIAEFAPVVLETARGGDPVAAQLVVDAAAELAVLVSTLRRRLGLATGTFPLALAGGVLVHAAELREQLGRQLAATGDVPAEVTVVTEPVRGAVALARRLA
ncbi:MAG: N-acetylglucosamine kinase, partial [Pirellulaceae bacterium]